MIAKGGYSPSIEGFLATKALATIAQKKQKQKMEFFMTLPLNIKYQWQVNFSNTNNQTLIFSQGNDEFISAILAPYAYSYTIGTPQDPTNNIFTSMDNAVAYYAPIAAPQILSDVNGAANNQYALSGNIVAWLGAEDNKRLSALETGKYDKPTGTTSQYVRGDGTLATYSAGGSISPSTPSRTIGTAFQISTTRNANVIYSIPITSNATLVAGSQASATLQYADNSAMTTNLVTLPGDAFGIASGLLVSGIGSLKLIGTIPAGKWVMITKTNIAGTPTAGTMVAQEVLL